MVFVFIKLRVDEWKLNVLFIELRTDVILGVVIFILD